MANTIILKRSATPGKVPTTAQLALGEIAINTHDGLLYIKKDDGTPSVVQIGGVTSVNGETGSVTLDTGDVAENGNLYFTNARARSALSAGTGISYNSSTGAISTTQNLSTAGSPSFAGLTLTGSITSIAGDIIPSADITYDLGSPSKQWKDIYVGPGSLYVNGSKVLQDDSGTIAFTADADQNIRIKTLGNGILQLGSSTTILQVDSTLQITSGKNITDSSGIEVNFGDNIKMNNNKIVGLGAPSANTDAATKKYVDDSVSAISTSSITQGNSSVAVVDSGTGTVTVTVDGSTALTVDSTGVTVAGNFTVSGTQTVVNSNTINLADNIITLNSDHTGVPTQNAGILVERGDEADVQLRWNEGSDKWTFTNDGAVYYPMAVSTTDLAEGTNLYFTDARARAALSASSATGISYNSSTGQFTLGSIPNSSLSNNSITINGTSVALGGTRTLDTDAISEGSTNQYFTQARARSSLSAGTGISYNSTTGAISTSAIPNASLANSAVTVGSTSISLGATATTLAGLTSVTSTSFTGALTGNADTATTAGKWTTARTITLGGDLTGSVSIDGSANVTLSATVAANSVALGTDTTGNYMSDVTAGTGITVTHTPGEGSNATIAVDTSTIATKAYVDSSILTKDNTDEITEGTTNLYFTNARARAAVSAGTGLSYNSSTGVFSVNTASTVDTSTAQTLTNKSLSDSTTFFVDETDATKKLQFQLSGITTGTTRTLTAPDVNGTIVTTGDTGTVTNTMLAGSIATSKITGLAASATTDTTSATNITSGTLPNARLSAVPNSALANSSITVAGTSVSLGGSVSIATTNVSEGTNLYYTDARARAAISAGGSLSYNSTTGVISYTTPSTSGITEGSNLYYTDARARAAVSAGTGISYNSSTGVITNSDLGSSQNIFKNFTDGTTTAAADSNNDTFKFRGSAGVTVAVASDDATHGDSMLISLSSVPNSSLANSSITINGTAVSLGGTRTLSTTDIGEGTNLYFTTARAQAAISAGTGISYASGVVTNAGVTSAVAGTGVSVSGATGAVTFSIGQAVATSSNVQFNSLGVGTAGSGTAGQIRATNEITAYYSDKRLKENIKPIENALAKTLALHGVTYNANDVAAGFGYTNKETQVGLLAQDVKAVLPEVVVPAPFDITVRDGKEVSKSGEDYMTVKYEKIVALLVEAIKELNDKVESLEAQLGGSKSL